MRSPQALRGIGASPGMVIGLAFVLDNRRIRTPKVKLHAHEIEAEILRFKTAVDLSAHQLDELKEMLSKGGEEGQQDHALILDAHRMMIQDSMFLLEVKRLIGEESINAEWAVRRVARRIKHQFDNLEDEYFRERRADVDFVADRVVRNLLGHVVDEEVELPWMSILVGHEVSPSDAAMMVKTGKVLAFLTDMGGHTSHTAIVARARKIPAVVGAGRATEAIRTGDIIALDGAEGLVLINPPESHLDEFRKTQKRYQDEEQTALREAELKAVSTDGHQIHLNGNIEFPDEVPSLLAHGAEGIGLYRTEFLFLNRATAPTEEEHYRAYKEVLESMGGRPVTIRTLDLGGDKVPGKKPEREANPAMGLRAIRYCLSHRDMFRSQLRALLRASVHGNLRIMFPLISSLSELREARSELEHCRSELGRSGVPVGKRFPIGIMVETPSAAWIADRLAQEADFFSIGTNDLIQYSLAIDRQNRDVAYLYRPLHLAVLRSLQNIVRAAKNAGIPVAMCGEMAGDPTYSLVLLAMGFEELSMSAGQLAPVKNVIRRSSRGEAIALLERAMEFSTAEEIERYVRTEMEQRFLSNPE